MAKAEPPTPEIDDPDAWRSHPRLLRHLRRYRDHANPSTVLKLYARKVPSLERHGLLRHIVHVGAWVALLPVEAAGREDSTERLSPVLLLAQLLRLRGQARLTPWLQGVLSLVAARVRHTLASPGLPSESWSELRRCLPPQIWRISGGAAPAPDKHLEGRPRAGAETVSESKELCTVTLGAVREKQRRTLIRTDVLRGEDREREIKSTLQQGTLAISEADPDAMTEALAKCIGLLFAPRAKTIPQEAGRPMTEQAKQELRSAVQQQLRDLLLRLLGAGRGNEGGLDWKDAGTRKLLKVPLMRLRHMLRDREPSQLSSSRQWTRLAEIAVQVVGPDAREKADGIGSHLISSHGVLSRRSTGASSSWRGLEAWQPNDDIKELRTVYEGEARKLKCSACGSHIISTHYFRHPRVKNVFVLVPQHGHGACNGAQYETKDGFSTKRDQRHALDFCDHKHRRINCAECGGSNLCEHKRVKHNCADCGGRNICPHHRRQWKYCQCARPHVQSTVKRRRLES